MLNIQIKAGRRHVQKEFLQPKNVITDDINNTKP